MIYSGKTLILSGILFILSLLALSSMYLPVFDGHNGFDAMENTFNSLRKGISPPFEELTLANRGNLGKNITADLTFNDDKITEAATRILLRNKMMVTPSGRTLRVQGDLGYTLQYFLRDIWMLYLNRNTELEKKYSMPATQSMFVIDRILKHLSVSFASQKMTEQENLIKTIRSEVLVPAYNLRKAPPISETSGITYLTIGTLSFLIIATLWDLANLLFFRTITDSAFLIRISGLEKKEKLAAAKKLAELKKKTVKPSAAPITKKTKVAVKKDSTPDIAKQKTKNVPTQGAPKKTPTKPASKTVNSNSAVKRTNSPEDKHVNEKKKIISSPKPASATEKTTVSSKKITPAASGSSTKKTVNKTVAQKNPPSATSQKLNKKVTDQPENKKRTVKAETVKPKTPTATSAEKASKPKE